MQTVWPVFRTFLVVLPHLRFIPQPVFVSEYSGFVSDMLICFNSGAGHRVFGGCVHLVRGAAQGPGEEIWRITGSGRAGRKVHFKQIVFPGNIPATGRRKPGTYCIRLQGLFGGRVCGPHPPFFKNTSPYFFYTFIQIEHPVTAYHRNFFYHRLGNN